MTPGILVSPSWKVFRSEKSSHDCLASVRPPHHLSPSKHSNTCKVWEERDLQVEMPNSPWMALLPINGFGKWCVSCIHDPLLDNSQPQSTPDYLPGTYLHRQHQPGRTLGHSCAHTAHSAATSWGPGRGHSGLETASRSSSLGGNELQSKTKKKKHSKRP